MSSEAPSIQPQKPQSNLMLWDINHVGQHPLFKSVCWPYADPSTEEKSTLQMQLVVGEL